MTTATTPATVRDLAQHLSAMAATKDGFSTHPETLEPPHSSAGFMVGLRGFELRTSFAPSVAVIEAWLRNHYALATMLHEDSNATLYVGGWWDRGFFYLDVSVVVESLVGAIVRARENGQLAIWDLKNNKNIETDAGETLEV